MPVGEKSQWMDPQLNGHTPEFSHTRSTQPSIRKRLMRRHTITKFIDDDPTQMVGSHGLTE